MLNDLGALALLGESADWLKDAGGASVRDRRLAVLEAFHDAWRSPSSDTRHNALRAAMVPLFNALRHNHLYPADYLLGKPEQGADGYLANPDNLRKDIDRLQVLCVSNKFGIGEVHLLYHTYLLYRSLHLENAAYDEVVEQKLADIIFLRQPVFRADNLGVFSTELMARFHTVRILRCMKVFGLLDDKPLERISQEYRAETREVLADELRKPAEEYILKPHHLPFVILDTASALEAYARAHAASAAPRDERSPEKLFHRLHRHVRHLDREETIAPRRTERLLNLAFAAIVRAMAHVDPTLAQRMYTFLRSRRHKNPVRHVRMFQLLPNDSERLHFLNFLFAHGKQNPAYYVERFQSCFENHKLRLAGKTSGFVLDRIEKDKNP